MEVNRIYFEDCIETLARIKTGKVDLLLQDTPFGATKNSWDVKPDLSVMWEHWNRVTKKSGAMIFFATQPFAAELIMSNPKNFRYDLIWYKPLGTGHLNANKMPMRNHESILVFYRKLPTYNPLMSVGKMKFKGNANVGSSTSNYGEFDAVGKMSNEYFPQSVINITNGDRTVENDHPTQKPLDIIRYLVMTYSNKGDLVYDGYVGSGTTPIACMEEERLFLGSENQRSTFDKAVKRIADYKRDPLLF